MWGPVDAPVPGTNTALSPGVVGIIKVDSDALVWNARIRSEEINAKINPNWHNSEKHFAHSAMRSAVRVAGMVEEAQRWDPRSQAVGVAGSGWHPDSELGKALQHQIDKKPGRTGPKDRCPYPTQVNHEIGWSQVAMSEKALKRVSSAPTAPPAHLATEYDWLQERLNAADERNRNKLEAKARKAEEAIMKSAAKMGRFQTKGDIGQKWNFGPVQSDVTTYESDYIRLNGGRTVASTRPSDAPVLKDKSGTLVPKWKPSVNSAWAFE